MTFIPLFPPYLNMGSDNGAVITLQEHLCSLGFGVPGLEITGEYDDQTAESVRLMQAALGVEQDGHCGPATRDALKAQRGVNLDAIPYTEGVTKTHWFGEGADPKNGSFWPPDEETQIAPEGAEKPKIT